MRALWARRQATKFNGVPYIVQRGAEAVYWAEGCKQTAEQVAYYMENSPCSAASTRPTSGCARPTA